MSNLDSSDRAPCIREIILRKKSLFNLYCEFYKKYKECLDRCPKEGISLEIGSGAGFIKTIIPEVITTDILPYETVDMAMDATQFPFTDQSVKSLFLLNTLHHLADSKSFFNEVSRCLKPGGRVFIIDQYHGWLSRYIYRYLHHEPYDSDAKDWNFDTTGPLSGANGALSWIIFCRDIKMFAERFPSLDVVSVKPHTPLRYWLTGGLKKWSLLPPQLFNISSKFDLLLSNYLPETSSFLDVEIVKNSQ